MTASFSMVEEVENNMWQYEIIGISNLLALVGNTYLLSFIFEVQNFPLYIQNIKLKQYCAYTISHLLYKWDKTRSICNTVFSKKYYY